MNNFMNVFEEARANNSKFIFVGTKTESSENIMVTTIPSEFFDEKEKFYNRSYNCDLTNIMYDGVRISSWTHGDITSVYDLFEGERLYHIRALIEGGSGIYDLS